MWFPLFCAESSNVGLRSAPACSFFPIRRCECVRSCVYACVHEHWTVWKVVFLLFYSLRDRVTGLLNLTVLKIQLTKTFYMSLYLIKPQLIDTWDYSAKRTKKYSWMLAPHMLRYRLNVNRCINMVVFRWIQWHLVLKQPVHWSSLSFLRWFLQWSSSGDHTGH